MHQHPTTAPGHEKQLNVTQGPKGAPQVVQFNQSEMMMPVRCDLHPWMNALSMWRIPVLRSDGCGWQF